MVKNGRMVKGQLRVYLGAAPGAGKTFRMLEEGLRRRERGTDVIVAIGESHERPRTEELLRAFEILPRVKRHIQGVQYEEMDLDGVLQRKPALALVDEFAHVNVNGSANHTRWQDVNVLLDAGIDVITTIDIRELESVGDVVVKITGTPQRETVPDVVVRGADQIELVDITPEALRRRLAHGNVFPAEKIDASLSNYFRTGNLIALRELALVWLADRVEESLAQYVDQHEILERWETRERLIVGVTGTASDEVLLRRAARIAARTGANLIAVHVASATRRPRGGIDTTAAREFASRFEGTFHEIVDDDIARALVAFALGERGTQIVIGERRPQSRLRATSSVAGQVQRLSHDLDVHVIALKSERVAPLQRRRKSRFTWRRRLVAMASAVVVVPLLTIILTSVHSTIPVSTVFPCYLFVVLALTIGGGATIGVVSALGASFLENFYFITPTHSLEVARPDDIVALLAFLVFSCGASVMVTELSRRSNEAERSRAEAEILTIAAATVATTANELVPVLDSLRAIFALKGVTLEVTRGATRCAT